MLSGADRGLARLKERAAAAGPPESPEDKEARMRNVLMAALAMDLGARYSPERASFDTFQVYHPAQQKVLEKFGTHVQIMRRHTPRAVLHRILKQIFHLIERAVLFAASPVGCIHTRGVH